jgi:hypothetical protein
MFRVGKTKTVYRILARKHVGIAPCTTTRRYWKIIAIRVLE